MLARLRKGLRAFAFERGGVISLATLLLYVWLAPSHIVDGDNAEFSTLGSVGGVAHPTGYPLYLLVLRACSLIGGNPAHVASIATAVIAGAQIFVLHAACRAWGARASAASVAVAVFATAPIAMRIHTEAEVFALNGLAVAMILWLAAPAGPLRGRARVCMLALAAGLGMSNHLTCVLVAPVGIAGAVIGLREQTTGRAVTAIAAAALLVVGLLPYAYLLVTDETLVSWGSLHGLGDLANHFLRRDYGGPGQFSPHGTGTSAGTHLVAFVHTLGRTWWWGGLVIGSIAIVMRLRAKESRWSWAMLVVSFLVAGPVLATRFDIEPAGIGLFICQRFHVLPCLLFAIPIAVGLDELVAFAQRKQASGLVRARIAGLVLPFVLLAAGTSLSLSYVQRMHTPAVERGLENTLRSLPVGAVVIVHTDLMHFGLGYLQATRGERLDVTVITWPQVPSPAYRARIQRIANLDLATSSSGTTGPEVATRVLASKRPLFIDPFGASIAAAFPIYPYGILFRVLPRGSSPPPINALYEMNRELFERFVLDYPIPGTDDDFATQLHSLYARLWDTIARALPPGEPRTVSTDFATALAPR